MNGIISCAARSTSCKPSVTRCGAAETASWHRMDEARAYHHPEQTGSGFHQISKLRELPAKAKSQRPAASITNVNPWLVSSQPCSDLLIRRRFDGHPND
jgi:hypothetical protein